MCTHAKQGLGKTKHLLAKIFGEICSNVLCFQDCSYAIWQLQEIGRLKCKHAQETDILGKWQCFPLTVSTTSIENTPSPLWPQGGEIPSAKIQNIKWKEGQSNLNQYNQKNKIKYIYMLIYFDMYISTVGFSITTSRTHSSCFSSLLFSLSHIWIDLTCVFLSFAELLRSIKTESWNTSLLRSSAHIPEKHTAASCSRTDWRRAP